MVIMNEPDQKKKSFQKKNRYLRSKKKKNKRKQTRVRNHLFEEEFNIARNLYHDIRHTFPTIHVTERAKFKDFFVTQIISGFRLQIYFQPRTYLGVFDRIPVDNQLTPLAVFILKCQPIFQTWVSNLNPGRCTTTRGTHNRVYVDLIEICKVLEVKISLVNVSKRVRFTNPPLRVSNLDSSYKMILAQYTNITLPNNNNSNHHSSTGLINNTNPIHHDSKILAREPRIPTLFINKTNKIMTSRILHGDGDGVEEDQVTEAKRIDVVELPE